MTGNVAELRLEFTKNNLAIKVARMWDEWNSSRRPWLSEKKELRQYLFATDTTKTTNSKLPWKNKTTIPKLTQIRDNLHSNYISALFPNDNWMKWEGGDENSETKKKKEAITAYLRNKIIQSDFRQTIERLLLDYIDYGKAIADVDWVERYKEEENGELIPQYIGPVVRRVSPLDIVINPMASDWNTTPKITRYLKSLGELVQEQESEPEKGFYKEAIDKAREFRGRMAELSENDVNKIAGLAVDGFGSAYDYYNSGIVEILEFEGDIFDEQKNTLHKNQIITVIDRRLILRQETNPSWIEGSTKASVNWRERPDNLWGMGPLDNLVGMQYRLDHLENAKADAHDLSLHPPMKIMGNVEQFDWKPGGRIFIGEDGDVQEMATNLNAIITAESQAQQIEAKMEEMAGAPKQAMGFRTPGEKTAYEVEQLYNAAIRIFQEKITKFERELLEPLLNTMLEVSRRNMDRSDIARILDDDLGVAQFDTITKEDITAIGTVRAVGARHFASVSQLIQNLTQLAGSPLMQMLGPHMSSKKLYRLIEDQFQLERWGLFRDWVGMIEQAEAASLQQELEGQVQSEGMQPGPEGPLSPQEHANVDQAMMAQQMPQNGSQGA